MQMEFKSVIFLALLSPGIAAAAVFQGIYGSVNVGMIQSYEKLQHDIDISFPAGPTTLENLTVTHNPQVYLNHISALGGLSLGYAFMMNPGFSLGAEFRGTIQHLDMQQGTNVNINKIHTQSAFVSRVKMDSSYALLAKLGWVLTPAAQIYGLVGPQWSIFSFNGSGNLFAPPGPGTLHANFNAQNSMHKWGYLLGLGFECGITENGSLGLEYNFAHYGLLNVPQLLEGDLFVALPPHTPGTNIHAQNSVKMLMNSIMLRYSYYFNC